MDAHETEQYWIRRYIRALRKEEFYMNYKRNKILQYFSRKKNLLGIRLGVSYKSVVLILV